MIEKSQSFIMGDEKGKKTLEPNSSPYVFTELKYPDALNGYTRNGSKLIDVPELYLSSEDYDRIYKNVVGDVLEAASQEKTSKCNTCAFGQNCLIKDSNISNDCDAYAEKDYKNVIGDILKTSVREYDESEINKFLSTEYSKDGEKTMNVMAVPNPNAYVISQSKLEKDVAIKAVKDFVEYLKEKCRTDPIYEPTFGVTFGSEVIITEKKVDEALKEFEEKLLK